MASKILQKKAVAPVFNKKLKTPTNFSLVGTNPATDLADVVTVVKNISGVTLPFGFLPPHGVELANGASVTIVGDLRSQLTTGGGRQWKRKVDALQNAIDNKLIQLSVNRRHIVYCAVDSAVVIAAGDLLYLDTDDVKPASSFSWGGSLAATQASFVNVFMGVALAAHAAGAAVTDFPVQISPLTTYTYDCVSETHEIGDTFGPAKHPSTNTLLNQKLEKAVAASSMARAVKRDAAAATSAVVRIQSAYWGHNAAAAQ